MRFLKRLAVGILLLILAAIVVVWFQPDDYRVTRSTVIVAPAAAVFDQVNDLRKWSNWSPWAKIDPNVKMTYSGPQSGPGASFQWDGSENVGTGKMTITEARQNERIATRLDFTRPFALGSNTDFVFSENRGQTNVIWTMSGTNNFAGKAIGLVLGMDKIVGPDFEKGLAQLKQVVERK